MVNIPTHRPPTTPGEMLREEFLEPMGLTQQQLADDIGVSYQRINELINGKRGITTSRLFRDNGVKCSYNYILLLVNLWIFISIPFYIFPILPY
jgi:transcriptional regulator with XRE-family HTH domain